MKEKGFVPSFQRFNYLINRITVGMQVVCIIAISILVVADVAMRYLLSKPITGCAEIVGYLMVCVGFLGMGMCTLEKSHLKIDIIVNRFPHKVQLYYDVVNFILVAFIGSLMCHAGFYESAVMLNFGTKGTLTKIPAWPFYAMMGCGYALLALAALSNLCVAVSTLKHFGKETDKQEGAGDK
ncbi:TRAP transporter small permease [Anaerotruncus sp. AF02-27]|uniref:TRAP transporter small permease n=1 Tax=Anaerotruncus sp. AF02-27 TaxID=2292191 RepID=UPI000E50C676|nr:TRAP transporter small permease [Anaerotruncus sp. AF02-27]RGX57027.1 TRAP transporter small permease [Anaerotruncus sp. AF02-27]